MDTDIHLLVVEDEAILLMDLEQVLSEQGFQVLAASGVAEAVGLIENNSRVIRGLITDIDLRSGTRSGWDLARLARQEQPELPVIYMTGASAPEWPSQGVPDSILIHKPFVPAQILTALTQLLNSVRVPPATTGNAED